LLWVCAGCEPAVCRLCAGCVPAVSMREGVIMCCCRQLAWRDHVLLPSAGVA
jgi:hypothetical protein